ncbi:MAG: ATPase, T2SS/T4P/T4SS family, partial [Candidatus Neomarinimicrobiota bacterium]
MAATRKKLGQLFIETKRIDNTKLEEALVYKKEHNVYLGKALVSLKMVAEEEVVKMVSEQLRIPWIDPLTYKIKKRTLNLISEESAKRLNVVPLFHFENVLTVACSDQNNVNVVDELSEETVMEINIVLATERNIEQALELHHKVQSNEELEIQQHAAVATEKKALPSSDVVSTEISVDTEIIEAVNMLMDSAVKIGASDVHIDPREKDVRIRFRVDGVLQQYYTIPIKSLRSVISRLKILGGMDIAETRHHQDGRFRYEAGKTIVDVRCATYPTPQGEKIVMRILDATRGQIALDKLGFNDKMAAQWDKIVHAPHGLVLVTGPTGSGKSTTLYATLNVINSVEINVLTVEDPIEYQLDNINQSQINEKAGITFSASLRAMLRLDPDIIMVGEMRDRETIELAIRAALTGHLVFSTLHTNDASSAYTRILNMGVDTFLVSSTVRAVLAQRLIRRLCPQCKKAVKPTKAMLKYLKMKDEFKGELFKPVGCFACRNNGYAGRVGVYELLIPSEEISDMV